MVKADECHPSLDRLQSLSDSVMLATPSLQQGIDHAIATHTTAIVVDLQTSAIVWATAPAEALFGYGPGELKGRPVHDLVPRDVRHLHRQWFSEYAENPTNRPMGGRGIRLKGVTKDGTEFPVEIGLSVADLNGFHIVVATILPMALRERPVDQSGGQSILRQ